VAWSALSASALSRHTAALSVNMPPPMTASGMGSLTLTNAQSDRLDSLYKNLDELYTSTCKVKGNRTEDLHQCFPVLSKKTPVLGLKGMVCVIGGASRGIGHGIAVRFGRAGAKVCVLSRSDGKVVTGPGTIGDVVRQVEEAGGEGLAVSCDVSKPASVDSAVETILGQFKCIDVVVNNASALYPYGVERIDEKRFDLMNHVCVRGAYLLGRALIPHMKEAPNPHVLNVAPAPIPDRAWMGDHVCYSGTKIGMGLLIAAWSAEFPRICFNSIWPMKMVATFAVTNTVGGDIKHAMNVASMADPAYRIVTSLSHSHHYLDNDVLLKMCRVRDVKPWQVDPTENDIWEDFMIRPDGIAAGERPIFEALPASSGLGALSGSRSIVVDCASVSTACERAGARTHNAAPLSSADAIGSFVSRTLGSGGAALDSLFIGAAPPTGVRGTLDVNAEKWEEMFTAQCKSFYYFVAKALPHLRKAAQPHIVVVAPAPSCHPKSFVPSVPYSIILTIRGLYVAGMAKEFDGSSESRQYVRVNAIWDGTGNTPPTEACVDLLAHPDPKLSGHFFAPDLASIPPEWKLAGVDDYTKEQMFLDYTTMWFADTACGG